MSTKIKIFEENDDGTSYEVKDKWGDLAVRTAARTWYSADSFVAMYVALACYNLLLGNHGLAPTGLMIRPEDAESVTWENFDDLKIDPDLSEAIRRVCLETLMDLAVAVSGVHSASEDVAAFYEAMGEAVGLGLLWD